MLPPADAPPSPGTDPTDQRDERAGLPPLAPDHSEQDLADGMDDIVPAQGFRKLPVVGLGGSAGSLAPLKDFFAGVAADSGMAYVVVTHPSPGHESDLASLLARVTPLPVSQVTGTVKVEADHVYVIPPGQHPSMAEDELCLFDLPHDRSRHVTVDLFFRTLADTHGPHASAVVLSGADGDGASGLRRIKERGGLTVAQDPEEAEHASMPRNAIGTGMVDWVLPVADMPARLFHYRCNEAKVRLPDETAAPASDSPGKADGHESALRDILAFLRLRTGRDVSCYKRATVLRRLGRRMQVNALADLPAYLTFLRTNPGEVIALLQDLLIPVTNFFRDRESFEALEREIPRLFAGKGPGDQVRAWVAGCATGEEAYSVAMLLVEHAATLDAPPQVQVFATDIDETAIRSAREGSYLDTVVADVSPERLRRFFVRVPGGYRVQRALRDTVLFAPHDLLGDSPFSRLDLATCRNLLVYLDRPAQDRAFDALHFALRPDGTLFLGPSESADDADTLFAPVDEKHRLYRRRPAPRRSLAALPGPSSSTLAPGASPPVATLLPVAAPPPRRRSPAAISPLPQAPGGSELHFRLLERLAPPSVVVDASYTILHLSETAGRFLRFGSGQPSRDLLQTVHPALRVELRAALYRARQTGERVLVPDLPIQLDGRAGTVTLRVSHVPDLAPGFTLVVFEETGVDPAPQPVLTPADAPATRELEEKFDHLRAERRHNAAQYEVSHEQLRASNEELRAINEELHSASEELESGREELQAINEELSTVNQELKTAVEDFSRANGDLQNLIASTDIATVFLDRQLRVGRYTPAAVRIFNLLPGDQGRPLADLTHRLDYPGVAADAESVLDDLRAVEREVGSLDGGWFFVRLLPYRTMDDHIAGVVLTCVDITERKSAQQGWADSEARLEGMFGQASAGIALVGLDGLYSFVNQRLCEMTGYASAELVGRPALDLVHPDDQARDRALFDRLTSEGAPFEIEKRYQCKDGSALWVHNSVSVLRDRDGHPQSCFVVSLDIHGRRQESDRLLALKDRLAADLAVTTRLYELIFSSARDFAIFTFDRDELITSWNPGAEKLFGYPAAEIIGQPAEILFTPEDRETGFFQEQMDTALRDGHTVCERWELRRDGSRFFGSGTLTPLIENGQAVGFVKIQHDLTAQRAIEEAHREAEEERARLLVAERLARTEAETASAAKDRFLAALSHELRTPLAPMQMAIFALNREKRLSVSGREMVKMIGRNLEAEVQLIDELLDVSRIVHGKLEFRFEPMDVHECLHRAVEVCGTDIESKKLRLSLDLGAMEHTARGDTARLRQAFWNVLKNAAKFTPAGGSILVRTSNPAPGRIAVEFTDSGLGIDPASLPKIFSAFEQGGAQVTQRYGGLGLGLAISKAVVAAHEGEITAASDGKDLGATFTILIPLSLPEN